jgi:hypothetical protein
VGDAWVHGGEEGRGKLRKARGRRTQPVSPRWPNGETRPGASQVTLSQGGERTRGTETSQYPEEEKSTERLLVAASERGQRSFESVPKPFPLWERGCRIHGRSWGERAEVPWNGLPERVRAP